MLEIGRCFKNVIIEASNRTINPLKLLPKLNLDVSLKFLMLDMSRYSIDLKFKLSYSS